MPSATRFYIVAAIASLTTACQVLGSLSPDPDDGASEAVTGLRTDSSTYLLDPEWVGLGTEIGISFTNGSSRRMYIPNCNGGLNTVLEKRVNGGWVPYWSPVRLLCRSDPIIIEPGSTLTRTIDVWGALPGMNAVPAWASADVEGTYRMVLGSVGWNDGTPELVPLELRTSNEFLLRR